MFCSNIPSASRYLCLIRRSVSISRSLVNDILPAFASMYIRVVKYLGHFLGDENPLENVVGYYERSLQLIRVHYSNLVSCLIESHLIQTFNNCS